MLMVAPLDLFGDRPPTDQASVAGSASSVTQLQVTLNNAIPAGAAIIVLFLSASGTTSAATGVSGGSGAAWTSRQAAAQGTGVGVSIWDSLNQAAQASPPTITVSFPSSANNAVIVLVVPEVSSFVVANSATGSASTTSSGAITPLLPNEFLVACGQNGNGNAQTGDGIFTQSTQTPNNFSGAYYLDPAAGVISTSWTFAGPHSTAGAIASYLRS